MKYLKVWRSRVAVRKLASVAGALALVGFVGLPRGITQTITSGAKFEAASVRLAKPGKDCTGAAPTNTPGTVILNCITVFRLIERAYGTFANGSNNAPWTVPRIEGGPTWTQSDAYYISAKAEDAASPQLMNGPMLQALLEERFKVKVHRETKELPVFLLSVAKGGSKLKPFKEGSCVPVEYGKGAYIPPPPQKLCFSRTDGRQGFNTTLEAQGASCAQIGWLLGRYLDRPVVDKTGLIGRFDAHMEFWPDQTPPVTPADSPSIFTAAQEQLGLRLQSSRSPIDVLVIDHVERPSEN